MAPRSRHSKSASVTSSTSDSVNGGMLPPATPVSKSPSPVTTRKARSRSTTSPQGPVTPVVVITKPDDAAQPLVPRKAKEVGKFTLTIVLSTLLEAAFQTGASFVTPGDLALVSRWPDTTVIVGLLGWKLAKLSLYWFRGFDAYDVASVSLLLFTPQSILLGLFYEISPITLTATTLSSVLANALPYYFFRPLSPSHKPGSAPKASLRNRPILTDPYTAIATSLLATTIFAVLLEASFATFLPEWLITHFMGLRTLEPAHRGPSGLPTLLLALLPAGVACMEFLFAPPTAAGSVLLAPPAIPFDPATASFAAHVYYNAWGWYTARQKELIRRTVFLTALLVTESVVQVWGTVAGVELPGALGYAGVWGLGVVVVGVVLDWVGGPSD
ncbi:hypothetical protein A1O1_05926 [Capronia coronata CBS 617.96]|uniref:Uncharacterized protein n=1 Tax=Capronia coronata CBS 617.96 TaxID=1182541 RepID=W9XYE7_9EURO|nr:uncharacterized protein A1O1_05926 [Capronia coronata CBS 617.96]EXJ85562.1 hypothetical protein A1O1_05926 [Capronia coronata CBS 617.96]